MAYQSAIIKKVSSGTNTPAAITDTQTPTPVPATLVGTPVLVSKSYTVSGTDVTINFTFYQLYKDASDTQYACICSGSSAAIGIGDLCTVVPGVNPTVSAAAVININDIDFTINMSLNYNKCPESLQQVDIQ